MSGGVLPAGWAETPLGSLLEAIEAGNSFKCDERPPRADEIGVLKISAVTWGEYNEAESKTCTDATRVSRSLFVQPGDLLLSRANTMELVGACVLVRNVTRRLMLSDKILRLRLGPAVQSDWILHFLRTHEGRRQLEAASTGNQLSMRNIPQERLRQVVTPVAPVNEQRRIVAKLEDLLARSRRAKEALDAIPPLLETLRRSILAAAFRGDLTAEWRAKNPDVEPADRLLARIRVERRKNWEEAELARLRAKGKTPTDDRWKQRYDAPPSVDDDELPALPPGWCWATAADVVSGDADIVYGIVQPGPIVADGVPYVRGMDIEDGRILESQLLRTHPDIAARYERASLKGGDVLLGIIRATKVAVVPPTLEGANITQGTARFRPADGIRTRHLAAWLASPWAQAWLHSKYRGIDMPGLNLRDVRLLPVPIAPIAEQEALASAIGAAEQRGARAKELACELLSSVSRLTPAVLAKAFRGELVPQDPADEPADAMLARIRAAAAPADDAGRASRTRPKRGKKSAA